MPLPKAPTKPATILVSIPTDVQRDLTPAPRALPPADVPKITPVAPIAPIARGPEPRVVERASPATRLAVVESKPRGSSRKLRGNEPPKLFVLDTNVLLHDPTSAFRFEEHDIFLPMMTLEELDAHKKGMSEVARSARQVSRTLDSLVAACKTPIEDGIPLSSLGNKDAAGRLFFQTQALDVTLPPSLPAGKADNQILGV
ncbi:MAG: PIN domain-containing protein, partial [Burkholderiaceae bacterium]